jgi:hypothetical protein
MVLWIGIFVKNVVIKPPGGEHLIAGNLQLLILLK